MVVLAAARIILSFDFANQQILIVGFALMQDDIREEAIRFTAAAHVLLLARQFAARRIAETLWIVSLPVVFAIDVYMSLVWFHLGR